MMAAVVQRQFGNYTLKSMKMGKTYTARAFLTGARSLSGTVAETEAATADEALDALQEMLGERAAGRRQDRRRIDGLGFDVPTSDEYSDALAAVDASAAQRTMLRAHAAAGDEGLTAAGLADAASYKTGRSAMQQYGKLAKLLADHLQAELPDGSDAELYVLAMPEDDEGEPRWVMHPELVTALDARP